MLLNSINISINIILRFYIFAIALIIFIPFYPFFPIAYLDPSWMHALNEAVSKGFRFGSDIVFTYGPLSALATKQYHPDTYFLTVAISSFIAIPYGYMLQYCLKGSNFLMLIFIFISPTASNLAIDVFFMSIPILSFGYSILRKKISIMNAIYFSACCSVLVFIKGSYLLLVIFSIILYSMYIINNRYFKQFIVVIACFFISTVLVHLILGYNANDYINMLYGYSMLTTGYSEAMASYLITYALPMFLGNVILLAYLLVKSTKSEDNILLLPFYILLVISFALLFKGGFVRQMDLFRIATTGSFLALIIALSSDQKKFRYILISVFLFAYLQLIDIHLKTNLNYIGRYFVTSFTNSIDFYENLLSSDDIYQNRYYDALDRIKQQYKLPEVFGSTDLYTNNAAVIIASGNDWSPRPIFQSYAAYTPELADLNRNHVLANPPENVFINVETIDGRFPTLDDGSIWPIFLKSYSPDTSVFDYLLIKRIVDVHLPQHKIIEQSIGVIGEIIAVPQSNKPVFATIELHKTMVGSLKNLFYKPEPLHITVYYDDFGFDTYRIIASMAKSPFLISPMVSNTSEFLNLYEDPSRNKRVRYIKIINNGFGTDWKRDYRIEFRVYE